VPGKVDVSGRFTLDKELKEFAGITDKLMIISSFNHKEIWSVDAWVEENGVMDDVDLSDLGIAF
jgi:DNA-binding transcriptional regulator/RsmH inhibitor MraZ